MFMAKRFFNQTEYEESTKAKTNPWHGQSSRRIVAGDLICKCNQLIC